MIDLSNLKAPGWARVVAELSSGAPDDKSFFERLMRVMAQVSAARRATLMLPSRAEGEEAEPKVASTWPEGADVADGTGAETGEFLDEAKEAARGAFTTGQARAFGLEKQAQYYDGAPSQGYVLAIPLMVAAPMSGGGGGAGGAPAVTGSGGGTGPTGAVVAAVITMLIEPRSKEAVRSTLAMAEVLAGYVQTHAARLALRKTQTAGFALDLATRLVAAVNTAPSFKGAVLQLTNDLARQFGVDRVALGWVRADTVRVEAISDTEHFDRRMAMVQKLQAAMDECLDQEQPIAFPQPAEAGPGGDVLLAQAIVHSHRELAAGDAKLKVCSLPLRAEENVVGVVTIETRSDGPIDVATIELLQAAMDLITPVLRIRKSDDRIVAVRTWDATLKGGAWFVGPKHTVWKLAGTLAVAAVLFVTFYQTTYKIGADAVLQPRVRRTISAPFDGIVRSLTDGLEPGLAVREGDVLVQLDTTEFELSRLDILAKLAQATAQQAAALKEDDTYNAAKASAQIDGGEAQLRYLDWRIEKSAIRAPIDGVVIAGDLKNRIGGTLKLGDPLLEVAKMDDIIAVAQVDDRDIWLVKGAFDKAAKEGKAATGQIATKARPSEPFELELERIVPLATAKEGTNSFEVRARLLDPADWMRPGMEGIAKLRTERHSLIWIGTRRVIDAVRLWLW